MSTRTTVKTSEIRIGDVVLTHGMEVIIDSIEVFDGFPDAVYACRGNVRNAEEVLHDGFIPKSFLFDTVWDDASRGWIYDVARGARWTVQGNDLARWCVIDRTPDEECAYDGPDCRIASLPGLKTCRPCALEHLSNLKRSADNELNSRKDRAEQTRRYNSFLERYQAATAGLD